MPDQNYNILLRNIFMFCAVMLLLIPAIALPLSKYFWLADLASHFIQHYLAASIVLLLCAITLRYKIIVIIALCAVITNASIISAYHSNIDKAANILPEADTVRILQFNMYLRNKTPEAVINWLDNNLHQADIVLLQECPIHIRESLINRFTDTFPYRSISLDWHREDILLSRTPLTSLNIHKLENSLISYIEAETTSPTLRIPYRFIGIHTASPVTSKNWKNRNQQLKNLIPLISNKNNSPSLPVILSGDLNTTPYSYGFRNLISSTKLRFDTKATLGTWPSFMPIAAGRITIDHTLATPHFKIIKSDILTPNGSDHFPTLTTLNLTNDRANK